MGSRQTLMTDPQRVEQGLYVKARALMQEGYGYDDIAVKLDIDARIARRLMFGRWIKPKGSQNDL